MSIYKSFLIKYSEIGLKGNNRGKFEDALVDQISQKLADNDTFNIYKEQERIYVDGKFDFDYEETLDKLTKIFGIYDICPVYKVDYDDDYKYLKEKVLYFIKEVYGSDPSFSFKVKAKRTNKKYHMHSDDINQELGHDILETYKNTKVDVHNPDIFIYVEIRNHINIYTEKIKGAGGMPIGTNGKAMLLLSGGIDSPTAGYMIAKRGVTLEAIYFHAPPYTGEKAKQKVIDLAKLVAKYSNKIKLHIINFTDIQLYIYEKCPHDELTIIMRRYMMKIAETIAKQDNCLALITGESIGQVASQTLHSLYVTNEICDMPVFRPLIGFDKDEIIELAKKINTFETSILPYEDCCTIFVAKHPVTKPLLQVIKNSEKKLDENIDTLLTKAIDTKETIICQ